MSSSVADIAVAAAPRFVASLREHRSGHADRAARVLNAAALACFGVLAAGQLLLAFYVVAFYGRAALQGRFEDWNKVLPNGYVPGATFMNLVLGLHLALAVVVIVGGALQLLPTVRRLWPRFHRWNGRVYLAAVSVVSLGGLVMVWTHAGKGDPAQHVAITLNALLILAFGGYALRHALARRFDAHRRWALRLYLAAAGVWFFRVGLMFWILVNRGPVGFDPVAFRGPTLIVLAFAQYLVPLALLELYFRIKALPAAVPRYTMAAALALLTLALVVGIAGASLMLWLPRVA
jgi:hypothetical protein